MFIGRERELKFLQDRYDSNKAQLVVLYGRRRVGKTELLKEFCKNKPHIFFSCIQSSDKVQLSRFSRTLMKEDIVARRYLSEFDDWEKAFNSILDLPYQDKKKLVVIDEFPYMVKNNNSIPSILQMLWDHQFKDENVMIILCGSAMSFIEKELLAEKNPLYGRATGIYKMNEMGFYDAVKFFPNYSNIDKVLAYSILGGIPHYLNQFNPNMSIEDNIKQNILMKGTLLYSEVDFILHQELREISIYNSIIEAVALGNTKLNEISQKSMIENTAKTSIYLKNLIELGIVDREFSIDARIKEKGNNNRGIYRLRDRFFRFWYTFGYANISQLEEGDIDGVYQYLVKPYLNEFSSLVFEDICKEYLSELQKRNELPFRYVKMGRWFGKTTIRGKKGHRIDESEIDILAIDKDQKNYLVGECKFKNQPFSYSEYLDVIAKLASLQAGSRFYYALFSKSGFDDKLKEEVNNRDNIYLYDLEQIVKMK